MITGTVQEVINNGVGAGSGIRVNGVKYGCFDPVRAGIDVLQAGDEVSFEFIQKGTYKNIQGPVAKLAGSSVISAPAPTPSQPSAGSYKKGNNYSSKGPFPIPAQDGQRSIVRQNSVTNAVALVSHFDNDQAGAFFTEKGLVEKAQMVIRVAQVFEEYSTGDLDEAAASAAVAALQQTDD